jgi:hypothetical protein
MQTGMNLKTSLAVDQTLRVARARELSIASAAATAIAASPISASSAIASP